MSLIGALKAAKKTAPFYSAVDEALANLKRPKGTGAEFLTEVMKTKGVKPAEIADRKLEQAFKDKGKMTKEEAQQVLKENPPPKLREKTLTEPLDDYERDEALRDKMEIHGYESWEDVPPRIMRKWEEELEENVEKYGDYKLAGGKNYREILLKLPEGFSEAESNRLMALEADMRRSELPAYKMEELLALQAKKQNAAPSYQSSHWKEDPNVLAHMRVQDRTGPNGEKILQVEEIQSDWHQAGRKKGYADPNKKPYTIEEDNGIYRVRDLNGQLFEPYLDGQRQYGFMTAEAAENAMKGNMGRLPQPSGVPDAPFKKNWHELAMKRLLNYAADKGYDSIAITPGAEHYRRYGSERIDWKKGDDGWTVGAKEQFGGMHDGQNIEDLARERGILLERNGDPVNSKEDLHRIISVVMRRDNTPEQIDKLTNRVWERMQIEPEGTSLPRKEGMEGFYDKMLTDYLNSFGNPYGAKVEKHSIPVSTRDPLSTGWDGGQGDHPFITVQDLNEPFDGMVELMRRNAETGEETLVGRMTRPESERRIAEELQKLDTYNQIKLHNFPITPEMRQQIQQKGLPLYQQIGIPTAGAGAASQMLEQEEPEYGKGGAIAKMALKAAPASKAPQIIKPSGLTELKKIVEQEKGGYGARRLERAADEIPNLEKLYSERALREAFTGDNARALMTMNPADFEKFAMPLVVKTDQYLSTPVLNSRIKARTADKLDMPTDEYVKYLMDIDRFDDVPFLTINKEEQGLPLMPFISGHEGRHRNRSLASRGEQAGLVQLLPRAELREPFPRRSQEQYIEALKEELSMTGNKVEPEKYRLDLGGYDSDFVRRPPIDLPDIYAKGGSVKRQVKKADGGAINYNTAPDMADGGRIIEGAPFKHGGKVNMTKNRDAMFMELSNKKLKRK